MALCRAVERVNTMLPVQCSFGIDDPFRDILQPIALTGDDL